MRAAFAIYMALGFGLIASPATATCVGCSDDLGRSIQQFYSGTGGTESQPSTSSGHTSPREGQSNGNLRTLNLEQDAGGLKGRDDNGLSINGHDDDVGMKSNGNDDGLGLKW